MVDQQVTGQAGPQPGHNGQPLSKVRPFRRRKADCAAWVYSGRPCRAREEQHRDELVLEGSRVGVPEPECPGHTLRLCFCHCLHHLTAKDFWQSPAKGSRAKLIWDRTETLGILTHARAICPKVDMEHFPEHAESLHNQGWVERTDGSVSRA